jgi:hypothetical protein
MLSLSLLFSVHTLNPKVIEHSCSNNAKMNIHLPHALLHTHTANTPQRKQRCARGYTNFICTDAHSYYYFFVASMTFPDSLYTCARSKRDSSHAHTHTPRQTTHKRPALPRRRADGGNFHAYFSARCFLRRGGRIQHTIIFIVFWVKFCVHDEGLVRAAVIGGVALYA